MSNDRIGWELDRERPADSFNSPVHQSPSSQSLQRLLGHVDLPLDDLVGQPGRVHEMHRVRTGSVSSGAKICVLETRSIGQLRPLTDHKLTYYSVAHGNPPTRFRCCLCNSRRRPSRRPLHFEHLVRQTSHFPVDRVDRLKSSFCGEPT